MAASSADALSTAVVEWLSVKDFPIDLVSVFNDRAEVTRRVVFTPSKTGTIDLLLAGLTECADADSIRINRVSGSCTIVAVSYDVHKQFHEPDPDAVLKQESQKAEIVRLRKELASKQAEQKRLQETRKFVETYLGTLVGKKETKDTAVAALGLDEMGKALTFYGEQTGSIDANLAVGTDQIDALYEKLTISQANCVESGGTLGSRVVSSRDVTVTLEVQEGNALELHLLYMVTGASWTPCYDIRVSTLAHSPPSMTVTYSALVKQATKEDWSNCRLKLSTANPSKGGMPLAPPVKVVRWKSSYHPPSRWANQRLSGQALMAQQQQAMMAPQAQAMMAPQAMMSSNMFVAPPSPALSMTADEARLDDLGMEAGEDTAEQLPPDVTQAGVADGGAGNATFAVERRVQIDADNKPHKETIGVIQLNPNFIYFATPELEEVAYLQCRAKNNSSYKLLASSKVAVFFNGSFVTSTSLKDTSPGEEFMTFLGVDAAVKVEHKRIKAKHTDSRGFMSKNQITEYEYCSTVTNTKEVPVALKVVGVVPRSQEDSITLDLTRPSSSEIVSEQQVIGHSGVMQNPITNNIVWLRMLPAGQKIELRLEYTITWPKSKHIEIEREK